MYLRLGIIAGMCLTGGASFNVLSPSVYKFICGANPSEIVPDIEEVFYNEVKTFLEQVNETGGVTH